MDLNRRPPGPALGAQWSLAFCKLLYTKRVVGANGFEPSTSWSRTKHLNPINALSGVAYGTRSAISPLLVVPNLYLARPFSHSDTWQADSESPSTVRMLSVKRKKSN